MFYGFKFLTNEDMKNYLWKNALQVLYIREVKRMNVIKLKRENNALDIALMVDSAAKAENKNMMNQQ
mgnify:CR=1 FL=1